MAIIQNLEAFVQSYPAGLETVTDMQLSQNENGRQLRFKIGGLTIPAGSVATISGTKPDGVVYSKTGTIEGADTVIFDEDVQMTAVFGTWYAKIRIINAGNTIASARVRFIIDKDPVDAGAIPSESELDGLVTQAEEYAEAAKDSAEKAAITYGSPLTASTASAMINVNRVYVYTGSESGYTYGNWYYYNGSAWVSGGVYNSAAVETDTTLTEPGVPADAEATGDEIAALRDDLSDSTSGYYPVLMNAHTNSYIDNQGKLVSYTGWKASDYIPCDGLEYIHVSTTVRSNYNAFYASKSETDFIKTFQTLVGDNALRVPEGAKYFRLSNTNVGLGATRCIGLDSTKIAELRSDLVTVNNGYKDVGAYIIGEYVDDTTGSFAESASYKRTGYIDISDYKSPLYFESNYHTHLCCFYDSSFAKVSGFTIYVGETLVNVPDNAVYCAFSLARYNAEITMYDSTRSLVKSLGITGIRDINLKYLTQTDILAQMIQKPLMLVYTDIHGSGSNFDRITKFYENNVNANVWYPINLGDTVTDQATDSIAFMDTSLGSASLMVIGNHDLLVSGTLPGITAVEAYDKYIAPNVSNWDVTQPANASENGYNYYYKDKSYSGGTIRLIVLDEYFYDQTQHNWFVDTLSDANTNGYSVIVCQHQSNVWNNQATPLNDNWAFATPEMGFDLYITASGYAGEYTNAAENRAMAVDDFIGNGGKFICWMSGHTHSDQCHTFTRTHGKQLSLVFSNAGMSMTSSKRIANYSSDCFQYVAVDLAKKYVYILRIGEAVDMWFHKNEFMLYDYEHHLVKEYY